MATLEPKKVDFKENFIPWLKASFSLFLETKFTLIPLIFFLGFPVMFFDALGDALSDIGDIVYTIFDPILMYFSLYIMSSIVVAAIFLKDKESPRGDIFIDTYKVKESIKIISFLVLSLYFINFFSFSIETMFGDISNNKESIEQVKIVNETTFIRELSLSFNNVAIFPLMAFSLLNYINGFSCAATFIFIQRAMMLNITTLLIALFLDVIISVLLLMLPSDNIISLSLFLLHAVFMSCFSYVVLQHIFFDVDPNARLKKKETDEDKSTVGQLT